MLAQMVGALLAGLQTPPCPPDRICGRNRNEEVQRARPPPPLKGQGILLTWDMGCVVWGGKGRGGVGKDACMRGLREGGRGRGKVLEAGQLVKTRVS